MHPIFDVVSEFARRRGASLPVADVDSGELALALDGRFIVHVRPGGDEVTFVAWLGDLPTAETNRQATLRQLLRAELARFGTDDPVLSADPENGELSLHRQALAEELDLAAFEELLKGLLDQVIRYRGLLTTPRRMPPPAPMIIRP